LCDCKSGDEEDVAHFLLQCDAFQSQRDVLISTFRALSPEAITVQSLLAPIGSQTFQMQVHQAVDTFLSNTNHIN
jgi:hypothetical protein